MSLVNNGLGIENWEFHHLQFTPGPLFAHQGHQACIQSGVYYVFYELLLILHLKVWAQARCGHSNLTVQYLYYVAISVRT